MVVAPRGMPTNVVVGVLAACYEFIRCVAGIAAASRTPTFCVCPRARGGLRVGAYCLFASSQQCSLSIHKYRYLLICSSFLSSFTFCHQMFSSVVCVFPSFLQPYCPPSLTGAVHRPPSPGAMPAPASTSLSGEEQFNACRTC